VSYKTEPKYKIVSEKMAGGDNNRNKPIKNNIIWGNSHVYFTLTATTEVHNDLGSMSEMYNPRPQDFPMWLTSKFS
jgi:hypothetical protein